MYGDKSYMDNLEVTGSFGGEHDERLGALERDEDIPFPWEIERNEICE